MAIWELDENFLSCPPGTARVSTISIGVIDTGSGVATVTASWSIAGNSTTVGMTRSGNIYTAMFGPFTYLTVPDNTAPSIGILLSAKDVAGNESKTTLAVTVNSLARCFG